MEGTRTAEVASIAENLLGSSRNCTHSRFQPFLSFAE